MSNSCQITALTRKLARQMVGPAGTPRVTALARPGKNVLRFAERRTRTQRYALENEFGPRSYRVGQILDVEA